ncbi:hypothetical protein ACOMHN_038149 [Nucella lapillus]
MADDGDGKAFKPTVCLASWVREPPSVSLDLASCLQQQDGCQGSPFSMMLSYCDARQPRMFPDYGHPGHHPSMPHSMPHPMPHHPHHPYAPRPRMDPASDVFTCLFGDLFVKW